MAFIEQTLDDLMMVPRWLGLAPPSDPDEVAANKIKKIIIKKLTSKGFFTEIKGKKGEKSRIKEVEIMRPITIKDNHYEFLISTRDLPGGKHVDDLRNKKLVEDLEYAVKAEVWVESGRKSGFRYCVSKNDVRVRKNFLWREIEPPKGYNPKKTPLRMIVGRDDRGRQKWSDLEKAPHMLITGQTGKGKSVYIHSNLIFWFKHVPPESMKIILVDMKGVDLPRYDGMPHMLFPTVTDAQGTFAALKYLKTEMEDRKELFRQVNADKRIVYEKRTGKSLPPIVLIMDDIVAYQYLEKENPEEYNKMVATLKVLLGQARALGIHLITSTQRPSTDIISGTARAQFGALCAFGMRREVDSRVVLDSHQAVGLHVGDMIFVDDSTPPGSEYPLYRAPYITSEEIENGILEILTQREIEVTRAKERAEARKEAQKTLRERVIEYIDLHMEGEARMKSVHAEFSEEMTYSETRQMLIEMEEEGILHPGKGNKPRTLVNRMMKAFDGVEVDGKNNEEL